MKGFHKAIAILLAVSLLVSSVYTSDLAYAAENASVEEPVEEGAEEVSEEEETSEKSEEESETPVVEEAVEEPEEEEVSEKSEETVEEPEEATSEEAGEIEDESAEEEPVMIVGEPVQTFRMNTLGASAPLGNVYWLPGGSVNASGKDYTSVDENTGADVDTAVKTFSKAVDLCADTATIYNMNSDIPETEVVYDAGTKKITVLHETDNLNHTAAIVNVTYAPVTFQTSEGGSLILGDGSDEVLNLTGNSIATFKGAVSAKGTVSINASDGSLYLDLSDADAGLAENNITFLFPYDTVSTGISKIKLAVLPNSYQRATITRLTSMSVPGSYQLTEKEKTAGWTLAVEGNILYAFRVPTAIYLDGASGDGSGDGLQPATAVKTFAQAKTLLGQYMGEWPEINQISVCGTVTISAGTAEIWSLEGYTGIKVVAVQKTGTTSYVSPIISNQGTLTLKNIVLEGKSGSVVSTGNNSNTVIQTGTQISGGQSGVYVSNGTVQIEDGAKVAGSSQGVYVSNNGTVQIKGGAEVTGNSYGVYMSSTGCQVTVEDRARISGNTGVYVNNGKFLLGGAADVTGTIYLNNVNYPIYLSSFVEPGRIFRIDLNVYSYEASENPVVVRPKDGTDVDASQYLDQFDYINKTAGNNGVGAKNLSANTAGKTIILDEQIKRVFIGNTNNSFNYNWCNASDSNDGLSYQKPVVSLNRALSILYEYVKKGQAEPVIHVCGRMDVTENQKWDITNFDWGGTHYDFRDLGVEKVTLKRMNLNREVYKYAMLYVGSGAELDIAENIVIDGATDKNNNYIYSGNEKNDMVSVHGTLKLSGTIKNAWFDSSGQNNNACMIHVCSDGSFELQEKGVLTGVKTRQSSSTDPSGYASYVTNEGYTKIAGSIEGTRNDYEYWNPIGLANYRTADIEGGIIQDCGGAVYNASVGSLTVKNSAIQNNLYMGGLQNAGTAVIQNTSFTGNQNTSYAYLTGEGWTVQSGAVTNNQGTVTMTECRFSGNKQERSTSSSNNPALQTNCGDIGSYGGKVTLKDSNLAGIETEMAFLAESGAELTLENTTTQDHCSPVAEARDTSVICLKSGAKIGEDTGVKNTGYGLTDAQGEDEEPFYGVRLKDQAVLDLNGTAEVCSKISLISMEKEGPIQVTSALEKGSSFVVDFGEQYLDKKIVDVSEDLESSAQYQDCFGVSNYVKEKLYLTELSYESSESDPKTAGDLWAYGHYNIFLGDFDDEGTSYTASDNNDGGTIHTAVRTFECAHELLKEKAQVDSVNAGKYRIVICGVVSVDDEYFSSLGAHSLTPQDDKTTLWQIDEAGLTSTLYRMPVYTGQLVRVEAGYTLELGKITLDGCGGTVENLTDNRGELIYLHGGTVLIQEDATLQNNRWPAINTKTGSTNAERYLSLGTVNMNGGLIKGITTDDGAIHMEGTESVFNLNGGTLQGSGKQGNGIKLIFNATLNISGGIIHAYNYGITTLENWSSYSTRIYMTGGVISQNAYGFYGSVKEAVLSNGKILKNDQASSYFTGNIYLKGESESNRILIDGGNSGTGILAGGNVYLEGYARIQNCYSYGLHVSYSNSKVYISGGTIADTRVDHSFGNHHSIGALCVKYSDVYMSGGTISGTNGLGVGYEAGGKRFEMSGGTIRDNKCGGVRVENGEFILCGGQIIDNTTESYCEKCFFYSSGGSGITATSYGKVTMTGGTISGNKSKYPGAGVYLPASSKTSFTMTGGTISGNVSEKDGGGVYICGSSEDLFRMTGGMITNNTAKVNGGGVYISSESGYNSCMYLSGGTISGNHDNYEKYRYNPSKKAVGIYVSTYNGRRGHLYLDGPSAVVDDLIYLQKSSDSFYATVQISKALKSDTGVYTLDYGNSYYSSAYKYGDILVEPESATAPSASAYISHFTSNKTSDNLMKSGRNIILGHVLFVDGVNGNDNHSGSTPDQCLATIDRALELLGTDYGVIYIVNTVTINAAYMGKTGRTGTEVSWPGLNSSKNYICRYVGTEVNNTDYSARANRNSMITVADGYTLKLDNNDVLDGGSEDIQGGFTAEGPIIEVQSGGKLTAQGTVLQNHRNAGDGGAIRNDGTVELSDGTSVSGKASGNGGAVWQNGELKLSGNVRMDGEIYLCGTKTDISDTEGTDHLITIEGTSGFQNQKEDGTAAPLQVEIQNTYDGRDVVKYTQASLSPASELEKYQLPDQVLEQYQFVAGTETDTHDGMLYLKEKGIVYVNGTDEWRDSYGTNKSLWETAGTLGRYPATAFATLKEAYQKLSEDGGGVIYITGEISHAEGTITSSSWSADTDTISLSAGTVTIRRYIQPEAYRHGSDLSYTEDYKGDLFRVEAGKTFTVEGLTIDGHSKALTGSLTTAAPGIDNTGSLFQVEAGGTLNLTDSTLQNNMAQTDGGGICNLGTVNLKGGSITGTESEGKGAAVYQKGTLRLQKNTSGNDPKINGSIYLYGEAKIDDTNYVVSIIGSSFSEKLSLVIGNPYKGRQVISYSTTMGSANVDSEKAHYLLEPKILSTYRLAARSNSNYQILELQTDSIGIYVDGVNGSDSNNGLTPDKAVKTLYYAYINARSYKTSVIYVVDTVTIDDIAELTQNLIKLSGGTSYKFTNNVTIRRYSKPDDPGVTEGYTHESNTHALFRVTNGQVTIKNLVIDGHRYAITSDMTDKKTLQAPGVVSEEPLFSVEGGSLTLDEGVILQNNVSSKDGGAVANQGTLHIKAGASLQNNQSEKDGGAIRNAGDTYLYSGAVLSGNTADGNGGAAANTGMLRVYGGTISGNTATNGSGIYQDGTLYMDTDSDTSLVWNEDQAIFLTADEGLGNSPSDNFDTRVRFITMIQSLPSGVQLPVDMDRNNGLAGGRKVAEMLQTGIADTSDYLMASGILGDPGELYSLSFGKRDDNGKILELKQRDPQIDVTVPLYVCMYAYGGDGKVVAPTGDAYKLTNHSECAVQVTSVQATENNWGLNASADDLKAGELYLNVNGVTVTEEPADVSGNTSWRMAKPAEEAGTTLELPVSAKIAGGSVNEDGESKTCAVTYTVKAVK